MIFASCGNSAKSHNDSVVKRGTTEAVFQVETDFCDADKICNGFIVTRGGTANESFSVVAQNAAARSLKVVGKLAETAITPIRNTLN